jgi:CRISPR-associated protein Csb1
VKLSDLQNAVRSDAAIRCRTRLQPAGGEGDKVFPPTYAGAVYAMEMRRVEGYDELVRCVLLDSVQSQANRAEEALQDAVDEGRITIPVVEVDFSDIPIVEPGSSEPGLFEPIGRVTSLEAPHRIADAILRDSELNGKPFRSSDEGKKIIMATLRNATPLFELCPTALVYGIWDSTGPKGGLGVKFQRAIVSEIIGIDAALGVKTSSRMDPLGIQLKAGPIYQSSDGSWTTDENHAKLDKKKPVLAGKEGKPSEVNHGNIAPSLSDTGRDPLAVDGERVYLAGGVTIKYAEQTTVLSLPALRRLKFPLDNKSKNDPEANLAAQTVLAALGLCGAVLSQERGLDLRSRCLLCVTQKPTWELLSGNGDEPKTFEMTAAQAIELLNEAIEAAKSKKLPWRDKVLVLKPAAKLLDLVRKSQELAVKSSADDGGDA